MPEIMNVNAAQYRALLKYDMIQPLDDYFDDYASDALKSYVESGGDELMDCITNDDGEIMAIPAPNLTAGGVNEMWIRQDWLDALDWNHPVHGTSWHKWQTHLLQRIRMETERTTRLVFLDRKCGSYECSRRQPVRT